MVANAAATLTLVRKERIMSGFSSRIIFLNCVSFKTKVSIFILEKIELFLKDLNVKGGGFTAKRGTAVRNISLVHDNHEHIEGRVNDQHIVILTQYVKKS